tara:strand:- start:1216 stop:2052 length:837 start_codon:yes stop_codon:yes gene_type:complete
MKDLDNLVEDIYDVVYNEKQLDSDLIEDFGERVKNVLKHWSTPRDRDRGLRMSSIGKPARQLWYESKDVDDDYKPSASTKIKFLYGHLLEEVLLLLVKLSGHEVTDEQKEVVVDGIKGHMDCKIDGEVIDIKTASNFAFKKFSEGTLIGNDPFGYMAQLSGYETAEGTNEGGFLAINKESGELSLFRPGILSKPDAHKKISDLKEALDLDNPPDRCYNPIAEGKKGNEILPPSCVYCKFKNECWSDANDGEGLRVFKYAVGLRYFTKVVSEPKVEEIA